MRLMANTVTLVIDRHPPKSPNATMRKHWGEQGRLSSLWQQEVAAAWHNAGRPTFERVAVRIDAYYRGDRIIHDLDNRVASFKGAIDGLKGRAITDDSAAILVELTVVAHIDNRHPRVELTIVERGDV